MHVLGLQLAVFNSSNNTSILRGAENFLRDHPLSAQAWTWAASHADHLFQWLTQPHILSLVVAFSATFTITLLLLSAAGFNPVGIGAGSLAAAFQSWAYGGFTPAGGAFATLTSMGMLGFLAPLETTAAAVLATGVTVVVWACGVGR